MAYKYKNEISSLIIDNPSEIDGYAYDEIKEVYRKAKAWDSLKELLMKEYPSVVHLADVSNGDDERGQMNKHEEVLEYMDKLDGTNEFSNLLSDLEDE